MMTSEEKLAALLAIIEPTAKQTVWSDNFDDDSCIDDFAGGNVDDAFYGGEDTGRVEFARKLLKAIA